MFAKLDTRVQSPVASASLSETVVYVRLLIMDWSNESVLEFIELLHEEPCIWNHKSKESKNRNLVNAAWARLSNNFSVPCPIEELKKKRNSLLTQYRDNLRRIKETALTGADVYRPSWFAFDAMDSYMADLYDNRQKTSGETVELLIVEDSEQSGSDHGIGLPFAKFQESTDERPLESPLSRESNTERPLSGESTSRKRKGSNVDPLSDSFPITKRQRRVQYSTIPKRQVEESFLIKHGSNHNENEEAVKECDLYGQLLAQKLKPLDVDDRLVLMNDIDNLVFKYLMNIRRRSKLCRSLHLPSMNQRHSEDRQSIDLPGPSSRSYQTQEGSQQYMENSQSTSEVPFRILKTETLASPEYTT